jgi:hypothetical protein
LFITSEEYLERVSEVIFAGSSVSAAVAFLGAGAERLFKGGDKPVRLVCNLMSGATNPDTVETIRGLKGVTIRRLDDLHAKVIVTPKEAIVGSANFSTNGLNLEGVEGAGWREAGYLTSDSRDVESMQIWFEQQWKSSDEITDADIKIARERWKARSRERVRSELKPGRLLAVEPEQLRTLPFYVALYNQDASKQGQAAGEKQISAIVSASDGQGLRDRLSYFEDWPDLPTEALLLCFRYGPRYGITVEGAWRRMPELDTDYKYRSNTYGIQLVVAQNSMLGLEYDAGDARELARRLRPSVEELCANASNDGSVVMSLYDVLLQIGQN